MTTEINHHEFYKSLMALCETDAFFYADQYIGDTKYRIFNYRLASYSDFQKPYAKYARGVMFEILSDDVASLVCLPMPKFFNLNENPETMNLNLDDIVRIEPKHDGSLISTFTHNDELRLKSKGSLNSQQVIDATEWLNRPENEKFKQTLLDWTKAGYTINMEWVSPYNRIVLGYEKSELIVLNMTDTIATHESEIYAESLPFDLRQHQRPNIEVDDIREFVKSVPDMTEHIEGFIYVFRNGLRVKHKTNLYMSLHHAKDSVNNPRRLFEAIIDEGVDDLRSMFATDAAALAIINDMEPKVVGIYNKMVKEVETFFQENQNLDRKSFAIKAKNEVTPLYFGLVMNLYVDRVNDYKEFLKGKWKDLGFRDVSTTE